MGAECIEDVCEGAPGLCGQRCLELLAPSQRQQTAPQERAPLVDGVHLTRREPLQDAVLTPQRSAHSNNGSTRLLPTRHRRHNARGTEWHGARTQLATHASVGATSTTTTITMTAAAACKRPGRRREGVWLLLLLLRINLRAKALKRNVACRSLCCIPRGSDEQCRPRPQL